MQSVVKWGSALENLSSGFENIKGADQPAHPRSLLSAYVISFSKNIISKLATDKIIIFKLVSVAKETARFIGNHEDRLCRDEAQTGSYSGSKV